MNQVQICIECLMSNAPEEMVLTVSGKLRMAYVHGEMILSLEKLVMAYEPGAMVLTVSDKISDGISTR